MKADNSKLILDTVEHLAVHEHLALLYSGQREQFDVITPFLRTGLERDERCLYLVDDITPTAILAKLAAEGIEVESALEAESLVIEPRRRGYFDPELTIRLLKEAAEAAIADGFSALRVASEMSWLLARDGGIERLNDFEAMLNYFFPQFPALGICQYDLQRFRPETVKEVVLCHPSVIVGGSLRKNPMEDSNVRLNLVITEHQRTEEQLRQSETRLAEAQRLAHMGSYDFDVHSGQSKWSDETFRILGLDGSVNKPSIDELIRAVHPEDKIRVQRTIVSALRECSPFELEFKINVGHSVKHILGMGQVALNESGEVTRMYGTLMDITERKRILDALQASEERYRRLLASVTDYVYSVSIVEGRTSSTSHGAGCLAVTGYSPDDHLADPFLWYTMVYPDDRILVTEEAEKRMRGESTKPLEHRIIHKNGSIRWVRNTIVPRRDPTGTLVGYDGLVEDISERKMIEESVRDSESHYRTMIDTFDGMVLVCGPDHRIRFMNAQFIKRAGRNAKGEDSTEFFREMEGICPTCINEKSFSGESISWEQQCPKDGRWFSVVNMPIRSMDGKVSVLATVQDITGKKEIEEALREHQNRSADLLETVEEWIWELYPNGIYKFTSGKAKELLGYEPVEFSGKSFLDFLMPFEMERISSVFREAVAGQKPILSLEHSCRHKDGHPVVLMTSAKPFFDGNGALAGYRCVGRDITEHKRLKNEMERKS
jgi:PAS domain S-box-containing protein